MKLVMYYRYVRTLPAEFKILFILNKLRFNTKFSTHIATDNLVISYLQVECYVENNISRFEKFEKKLHTHEIEIIHELLVI